MITRQKQKYSAFGWSTARSNRYLRSRNKLYELPSLHHDDPVFRCHREIPKSLFHRVFIPPIPRAFPSLPLSDRRSIAMRTEIHLLSSKLPISKRGQRKGPPHCKSSMKSESPDRYPFPLNVKDTNFEISQSTTLGRLFL